MKKGEILTLIEIPFDGQVFLVPEGWSYTEVIRKSGYWEPDVSACILDVLTPETVFADAGAQVGAYTLLAAKRVASVFAFEPQVKMREILRANVERNGHQNVTISDCALYSRKAEGYIGRDLDDGTGRRCPVFQEGKPPEGFEAARATTLDAYLGGRRVDLVKIDVEGAECEVALGMAETIGQYAPTLVVELHAIMKHYGRRGSDLARLFEQWGYQWRGVADFGEGRGLDWGTENNRHIIAWKP